MKLLLVLVVMKDERMKILRMSVSLSGVGMVGIYFEDFWAITFRAQPPFFQ